MPTIRLGVPSDHPHMRPIEEAADSLFHAAGVELGGAISGEHGVGEAKKAYFLELEDPTKIALMTRIKAAFDPNGILNPGNLFD